ncbi:MAG: hypothetical protein Q8Q88_10000 [Phenylobacterium sp.]|uniref:hypothetical protein n=1 Tax=Phenylobacterium sp. TaxID=1871053 RepID=UPI002735D7D5|nr:hypothetical protein [Phenylobacterium sp.]MDP3747366.1 hypothetical protein [Phenylobacterium sp.]
MADLARARAFIHGAARLIDRRWFAVLFDGDDPSLVLKALSGYQNVDGGFGHGLEPDSRTPRSQPLNVEVGLQYMADAGVADQAMAKAACDFLQQASAPAGGVPILLPGFEADAHAPHWRGYARPPELVPNGGIVGLLYRLDVEHPWREATAEQVWRWIQDDDLGAHDILDAALFLESVPDRRQAEATAMRLAAALPGAQWFKADPGSPGYGLTPLWFAPTPDSFCRSWFEDAVIALHLDHLAAGQQADGGWPISWDPPGPAALLEWRGVQTVKALRTLRAYGRI